MFALGNQKQIRNAVRNRGFSPERRKKHGFASFHRRSFQIFPSFPAAASHQVSTPHGHTSHSTYCTQKFCTSLSIGLRSIFLDYGPVSCLSIFCGQLMPAKKRCSLNLRKRIPSKVLEHCDSWCYFIMFSTTLIVVKSWSIVKQIIHIHAVLDLP